MLPNSCRGNTTFYIILTAEQLEQEEADDSSDSSDDEEEYEDADELVNNGDVTLQSSHIRKQNRWVPQVSFHK